MTEETRPRAAPTPDDRELDQYLKGGSPLSRLYREASREQPPPELDEAILAAAKREVRARPDLSKLLAPVALAASLILGVNLAWNVHKAAPVPAVDTTAAPVQRLQEAKKMQAAKEGDERELSAARDREAVKAKRAPGTMESGATANGAAAGAMSSSAPAAAAAPPAPMMKANEPATMADAAVAPAPLTEPQKIDRLLAYVGSLKGAVFVRNGQEHTPAEAAEHMKLKRQKAGDRVKTAEDFIKYCASYSTLTGEAYLVRFPDGRTRTAEDVLREQLAQY